MYFISFRCAPQIWIKICELKLKSRNELGFLLSQQKCVSEALFKNPETKLKSTLNLPVIKQIIIICDRYLRSFALKLKLFLIRHTEEKSLCIIAEMSHHLVIHRPHVYLSLLFSVSPSVQMSFVHKAHTLSECRHLLKVMEPRDGPLFKPLWQKPSL